MELNRVLENAPFSPAQRGWLTGFFAEVLGAPAVLGAPSVLGAPQALGAPAELGAPAVLGAPANVWSRERPLETKVLAVRTLTGKGSAKDVRFVSFDLRDSGLTYNAGDSLGVFPENCPELVELIIATLGVRDDEPVPTPGGKMALRDALTQVYTITQSSDQLLVLLAKHASDSSEAAHLAALAEDDTDGELDGMDLHDVLLRFPSARGFTSEELVAALAPIEPRLYSISSSQRAHPNEVHLTVGVVRYNRAGCERIRKGVASTFLSERVSDRNVRIFVQRAHGFAVPANGDAPTIMIGPGTGIAPFRAFLQERAATSAPGKNWLFFGDQRRDTDFLYQQELETWTKAGVLTHLETAFSRDQAEKVYVQHRMLAQAPRLWEWLQNGAHVYVCGDAKRMARDVDHALLRVVKEQGRLSDSDASAYVATMRREKRYQRDVY